MPSPTTVLLLGVVAAMASVGQASFQSTPRLIPRLDLLRSNKLRIYGRSLDDYSEYALVDQADNLLRDPKFDPSKPTMFYFHGYQEHAEKESVKTVMTAFIAQGRYNVVFVDWSKAAAEFYVIPLMLAPEVGRMLARQLDAWHAAGALSIADVYIVGHSLGGQAAGFAGKTLTQAKVPRITALDPARPGFNFPFQTTRHITASDAQFVDVIHTDGGNYGVSYPTGHADFYPNGGKRLQPGCPTRSVLLSDDDFCSHWRSWRFFAESLDPASPPYYALACDNASSFQGGRCANNQHVIMGYDTPSTTRGTFYLETNSFAPYSRALAGLRSTIPGEQSASNSDDSASHPPSEET